jgi:hypothetical protein
MELLCYKQGLLTLRIVKQFELRLCHSKPVIIFKRICRLSEHWRMCCQEVEVGELLRLLMVLQTSCLTHIDGCQPLYDGI